MGGDALLREEYFFTGGKAAAATLAAIHKTFISSAFE